MKEGDTVNVYIDAWRDEEYSGAVDEIGDAQYDSSTGTTYSDVTVKLSGDTAKLYDGMTAELTFITKETETVTYVSNRAVFRENGRSYVRMYDENGNVVSVEIVTGFSDGSQVEVTEGLTEGDTVLIESGGERFMRLTEIFRLVWLNLASNKFKVILTSTGLSSAPPRSCW